MEWTFASIAGVYAGMIVGGETVVLPIVLSSSSTPSDYVILGMLTAVATLVSDSVWYGFGRFVGYERISSLPFVKKRHALLDSLLTRVEHHGFFFIFLSKFVYGTRAVMQISAGLKRVPYVTALIAAMLGALVWYTLLIVLHRGLATSLTYFPESKFAVTVEVLIFIALAFVVRLIVSKRLKGKYFQ